MSEKMQVTRRGLFKNAGLAAIAAGFVGAPVGAARADEAKSMESIKKYMGGDAITDSPAVKIDAPIIAENGAVVPIKVEVDHPMEAGNYIESIGVFVDNNPTPFAGKYVLSPANGKAYVSARLKIGKTSNVRAIARTNSGKLIGAVKEVKVTIGGCGG
ncbi:thiosulfate oxidation carrier protein SoxY [Magnetofaba australis]|uniref:Putative thiosulfate-binding protein SoxY n=1 Tax=Magnetofaba australis IT-1 TaxID=1434232 RepID=A0A1Y2K8S5_9PROT|nr:thiosulfate oxidation carrier protein SoxY [Magnetofaba australis]OSM05195.1 putative thiosulfate-binding protein SoxY [Magnetofaba australis IT-1]